MKLPEVAEPALESGFAQSEDFLLSVVGGGNSFSAAQAKSLLFKLLTINIIHCILICSITQFVFLTLQNILVIDFYFFTGDGGEAVGNGKICS